MTPIHIPLGKFLETLVNYVQDHVSYLTRPMSNSIKAGFNEIVNALAAVDPWIFILVSSIAIYFLVSRNLALFNLLGLGLIFCLDLWVPAMETLVLVVISSAATVAIGLPIGIMIALQKRLRSIILPMLDIMQTMPAYVYLIPVIPFFGLGSVTAIVATMIFAMPPVIRLTCLGINQVSRDYLETADAFGSSRWQKLVKVQLPLATKTIISGINQGIMLSLSMVVLAALIGAKGLGSVVWKSIQRLDMALGFEAGISVVILAILIDRITKNIATKRKSYAE
jgi:glycine betaine/proline transport system permease protein